MKLQRFIIKNLEDEKKAKLFEKHKLGKIVEGQNIRCKHCSIKMPLESFEISNGFWTCTKGHHNKYNEKYILPYKTFEFNLVKFTESAFKKLDNKKIENYHSFLVYNGRNLVPISFFDSPMNSSLIVESLEKSSMLVYFDEQLKRKCTTPYNNHSFINLDSFLMTPKPELIDKLETLSQSAYPSKVLVIMQKIIKFIEQNQPEEFEKEIVKLFNDFKNKEKEIENLLTLLRVNKNNPTGNKFVHIGSNYPVDFCPIELFSYFNALLEVSFSKGYDAKMFTTKLTYQVYSQKKNSNSGKKLVFITSTNDIDGKIWRDLLEARKNNDGNWFYLILDLDLMSLILYFVGHEEYFN